ncbi:sugar ABC transporter substrate-binding protein [Endozoicomonas numazuensis]|uniref:Probable sugar-binding periplasmic protein n=1 Tax=Endozoicomonas numazuensis TaxID=1137799 RepID=A0A081NGV9_9GAMM|nr:sugar ABC transporter substrate-binding protein [Endozoicomonas numazuensis]
MNRTLLAILFIIFPAVSLANEVEVLHWWTSPGENAAVNVLERQLSDKGLKWKDFGVEGGGGSNAMTVLKSRVISGNPPAAAQIRGKGIQEWASLGLLREIDDVARKEQWDAKLPEMVSDTLKFQGHYVAAPVNIHRNNWLWVNPEAFRKAGQKIPETWEDMFRVAPKLKEAGYIPLAYGGEPWQASAIFESVLLAKGGAEFYRQAMVDNDPAALTSKTMIKTFKAMARMRGLFDQNSSRRSWDQATQLVIDGKAAMQLMGDWAKGEFLLQGKQPGIDFLCIPAPGTKDTFVYNIDSFVMFNMPDEQQKRAQQSLASLLMNADFQRAFNQKKGGIPALDLRADQEIDSCAQKSRRDFNRSMEQGTLVPSTTHGMAAGERVQHVVSEVVSQFINDPHADPTKAVKQLSLAIQTLK